MKRVIFIVFSIFIVKCLAARVPGKCPNIEYPENFDPKKMIGKWYSVYETGKQASCVFYEFEQVAPNYYLGHMHHLNLTISLDVIKSGDSVDEVVVASKFYPPLHKSTIKTFATDYENYAGIFMCKENEDSHYPHIEFWSREATLDDEKVQQMKDVLSKYDGIDISDLKAVDHSDCPY